MQTIKKKTYIFIQNESLEKYCIDVGDVTKLIIQSDFCPLDWGMSGIRADSEELIDSAM